MKVITSLFRLCCELHKVKMDLFIHLNVNNDKYFNTLQREAGGFKFLVCDKTNNLINRWYDLCCNYTLIDDSPSKNKNLECFKS